MTPRPNLPPRSSAGNARNRAIRIYCRRGGTFFKVGERERCRELPESKDGAVDVFGESWPAGEVRALPLEQIGERYRRYRLSSPEAEEEMVRSLRRWGQLAPITVWIRDGAGDGWLQAENSAGIRLPEQNRTRGDPGGCTIIAVAIARLAICSLPHVRGHPHPVAD